MGARRATIPVLALVALAATACDDTVVGSGREITLLFCGQWAAYQNVGEPWVALPVAPDVATFEASDRLAIATVSNVGSLVLDPRLDIYYMTAAQAESTFTCGGTGNNLPTATKQLRGSVTGLGSGATVTISMGVIPAIADANFPSFLIRAPREDLTDLIATHRLPSTTTQSSGRADKVIVRRGESHADGATMPVLDFSSAEAFAPQSNTLTINGMAVGELLSVQTLVTTVRGASNLLKYDFNQSASLVTTYSLPDGHRVEDDLHQTTAAAGSRSITFFYNAPADRTFSLGPVANTPVFTIPPTSSRELRRIEVRSQPEYDSQIAVTLRTPQPSTARNVISISATKEFFGGTPATWLLVLPDLTGVPGFSPSWEFGAGGNAWTLMVTSLPFAFAPDSARDGDVFRTATASGVTVLGQ